MAKKPGPVLVSIQRHGYSWPIRGFVVAESKSLIALHQVDDNHRLNGYCVIRQQDVLSRASRFERRALVVAALRLKGQSPVVPEDLQVTSMRKAMVSAERLAGVLIIHREKIHPNEVEVGTLRLSTDSRYVLRWLTLDAKWENDDRPFLFRDVSLLEFGTEYDQTLLAVAALSTQK